MGRYPDRPRRPRLGDLIVLAGIYAVLTLIVLSLRHLGGL